jgi:nucleotide-binding universal stress UspA family protein
MTVDRMRILFATDGSTGAGQALQLLASSFDPSGVATVEVIAVARQPRDRPGSESGRASQALLEQSHRDTAKQQVHAAADLLRAAGFEARETVRDGHPAEAITTHAATGGHDLIVLGTRGLSGLRRRVIGSVSGKVARYAETSVLVVRTRGPIRQILLGYDASPDADEALDLVARLPLKGHPQAIVCSAFHVVRPLSSGLAPTIAAQVRSAYHDSLRWAHEAAVAMAASAAQRLRDRGVSATARAVQGPTHEQLAVLASESGADLLVVGSRGLSAIQRFFLGSTSAALVTRPPTSVLVARRLAA